mmetsp:Transcript_4469/g.8091  ORF Transcript_4469/g.8091 Transcript_4469/m.8091 type:complete len:191 (-) Transcript_4469:510-1082(-)
MGTWIMDIQCVAVSLLSAGRLEMLPMHNYPLLALSIGELWSIRYNLLIHTLLKETIYIPLRRYGNYSVVSASLAAFAMSGVLHSWVAYVTFGQGIVRACAFFVIQVPWIAMEQSYAKEVKMFLPKMVRWVLTFGFFFATLPLYAGLFVDGYPKWLENNNPSLSVPKVPILGEVSQFLMTAFGIDSQYSRF